MLNVSPSVRCCNLARTLLRFLDGWSSMIELKQSHALILTLGLLQNDLPISRLVHFSATSDTSDVRYSEQAFLQLTSPTIFNWNSLIRGYAKSRNPHKAVSIFVQMLRGNATPNHLTYPFLAKASSYLSNLHLSEAVHGRILRSGFGLDRFIRNSLIHSYGACREIKCARKLFDEMSDRNRVSWNAMLDAYAKYGDLNSARLLFDSMPERDVVSWSSLIDGYAKNGDHKEALNVFECMKHQEAKCNEVTLVSVLGACAHLGALEQGRMMHKLVKDCRIPLTLELQTSIVDMYAKCGAIDEALTSFRGIVGRKTDVLIWNAIIGGVALHGLVQESFDLFAEMQVKGVDPDEITYLCLLSACAHGGLVREAWDFLGRVSENGMMPTTEHYSCMVDVLARAGRVVDAYQFLGELPNEPTASMLGALMSGCLNQGEHDLVEIVGKKLIELEPDHDGRYVGLSNVYAVLRRWGEARTVRQAMEIRGVKKSPGYSSIEIHGDLHMFLAYDKTHRSSDEIYVMLNFIIGQLKADWLLEI